MSPDLQHYDFLDGIYRAAIGNRLHHGLWDGPSDSLSQAQERLEHAIRRRLRLQAGDHLIDVGAGYGAFVGGLPSQIQVTAVNPQERQREQGQRHTGPQVRWMETPWPAAAEACAPAQTVLFLESLEHLPDPAQALHQALQCLRPRGRLIHCGLGCHPEHPPAHLHRLRRRARYASPLPSADHLLATLRQAGAEIEESADLSAAVAPTWIHIQGRLTRHLLSHPGKLLPLLRHPLLTAELLAGSLQIQAALRARSLRYHLLVARRP